MERAGRSLTRNLTQNEKASVKLTLNLETLSKRENKGTVSTSVQASLSTSPAFPVLKCYMHEAKGTRVSGRRHTPDKPLLVLRQN